MDDRQLIEDLLSALEYHTEQTRPIEFSKVAIQAAREYLRKPAQQWSAGVPPLYPEPEPGVSIKAEYEPAQPMHPEIKKMYEDYFDKCFRESSAAVPENFMDALKFDTAMRDVDAMVAVARADERGRMCEQLKECSSEKSTSNEANRSAVLGEGGQAN